jgi:hypothetical protein
MKKIYALTDNSKQAYAFLVEPFRIFATKSWVSYVEIQKNVKNKYY